LNLGIQSQPHWYFITAGRFLGALTGFLLLGLASCEMPRPTPPPRDRAYLLMRNGVDPKKPCLISRFARVQLKVRYNVAYVPVILNGHNTVGRLDTGSEVTMLTPAAIAAAGLQVDPKLPKTEMLGVAGAYSVGAVRADTLQIGQLKMTRPAPLLVQDFIGSNKEKIGALIGTDMIDGFDWDLDFAHEQMTAYRTQNCHDIDPLWPTKSTGVAITRGLDPKIIPLAGNLALPLNVTLAVEFDAGTLTAVLDTGATHSFLTRMGARKAGITAAELDRDPEEVASAIDGSKIKVRRHRVAEFVVGQDLEHDFPLEVAEGFDRRQQFDMILGMDWIAKHHLWISYTTDSLYIDSGELKPASWRPAPQVPE
jgi:predicted aspartyl protease